MTMRKRPGKVVRCQDGRIGRTYNDEPFINGKVRVYLFPESARMAIDTTKANMQNQGQIATRARKESKEPERRLCDPATLKVIGFAD